MALVSQECLLFVGTVRDNIAFGCPGADLAQVLAAAQAAHAHGFIMALPQGYDTPLGVPGAVQLSGERRVWL
jgi:ABC-type multidrug transport system fused ATPase/permease subunit